MNWHRKSIWRNAAPPSENSQQVRNGEPPRLNKEHLQTTLKGKKLHASPQGKEQVKNVHFTTLIQHYIWSPIKQKMARKGN